MEEIEFPDSEDFFQQTQQVLVDFEKRFPYKYARKVQVQEVDTVDREAELLET